MVEIDLVCVPPLGQRLMKIDESFAQLYLQRERERERERERKREREQFKAASGGLARLSELSTPRTHLNGRTPPCLL